MSVAVGTAHRKKAIPLDMIEVICIKDVSFKGACLKFIGTQFTVGETYIASLNPTGTNYQVENNRDQTCTISVALFFEHFKEVKTR